MIASLFASFLSFFALTLATASPVPSGIPTPQPEIAEEQVLSPSPSPELSPVPSPEVQIPLYTVSRVIDGDTIEVKQEDRVIKVRLIGINTPETVDPRRPVQCFGKEASSFLKSRIEGKSAQLTVDPTQANTDRYSRALRYVSVDGQDIGALMIAEGYAQEYTYDKPYEKQETYKQREKEAREGFKGLWNPESCATLAPSPSPSPTPKSSPTPKPTPVVKVASPRPVASPVVQQTVPTKQVVAPAPARQPAGYSCNCSKTCKQMGCSEAQYQLNTCGCGARDGDGDGVACDAQCQ